MSNCVMAAGRYGFVVPEPEAVEREAGVSPTPHRRAPNKNPPAKRRRNNERGGIRMTSGISPKVMSQSKIAAASGWIGSALEYYDFFIYATAASLVFPQIFFPSQNPTVAIVASLATYGVGYVARPIGAFFLGHWGDTHGRKTVLILCMFLMGI